MEIAVLSITRDLPRSGPISYTLHRELNDSPSLTFFVMIGKLYCGQFTVDDEWYRVKVNALAISPPPGSCPPPGMSVLVTYLDFGNSEWLPTQRMRLLPHGLETISSLAKNCALADVLPTAKVRKFS